MSRTLIENPVLEKHDKYLKYYLPFDTIWGIGIENETYLEFENKIPVDIEFLLSNHTKDEYSYDYFDNYKPGILQSSLAKWILDYNEQAQTMAINLPILVNSFAFNKLNIKGEKISENRQHSDIKNLSLLEFLAEKDTYFSKQYGKKFTFDGDTIEFFNTNFCKGNIKKSISQLKRNKKTFVVKLNKVLSQYKILQEFGSLKFSEKNHGFATFITTKCSQLSVFNNMTYHFNFTLPTALNESARIKNNASFISTHRQVARILQWTAPLLIAKYGAGDILATVNPNLSGGSQRCALSTYIGVGTYDTETMKTGSNLTAPFEKSPYKHLEYWWYNDFRSNSDYNFPKEIGFDISFNKHLNHGIEFRIFDFFPQKYLNEVLHFLAYAIDHSQTKPIQNPVFNPHWNKIVSNIIRYGSNAEISWDQCNALSIEFEVELPLSSPIQIFNSLYDQLKNRYRNNGKFSTLIA